MEQSCHLRASFVYFFNKGQMLLSAWYPLVKQHTAETVLIDMDLPVKERNALIEETIARLGPVFVRLDELSPKWFQPCSSVSEVWSCLKVPRTRDLLNFTRYLCLRRWVDYTDLMELRCFVNGKITAISQNDAQKDSEPIAGFLDPSVREPDGGPDDDPVLIKAATLKFCTQLLHLLPHQCTLDLAFDKYLKFSVVEVNSSYKEHAGTGLFELDNPNDAWQLERGQNAVVFRYFATITYDKEQC